MKHKILIAIFLGFFAFGCQDAKDSKKSNQLSNVQKAEDRLSLTAGVEAKTNQKAALWTDKELKILEGPNWANAKAGSQLKSGAVVYVTNVGDEYAKVITLIGQGGYIVKELLDPISKIGSDSVKYFNKNKIVRINTFVDGIDVGTVKLWENMNSRDRMVEQLKKDEKVAILQEKGEYVKVVTINGTAGWCMKGFIK
jgi:SH3-like domain-containing protein